jgi:hypothetical protein
MFHTTRHRETPISRMIPWGCAGLLALAILAAAFPATAAESAQFQLAIVRASRSGSGIDKRLAFAEKSLLAHGFRQANYLRGYQYNLTSGRPQKFSIAERLSGVIELRNIIGEKGERVQFDLVLFDGNKKQAGAVYSIWKEGPPGIVIISQSQDSAYIIIVTAR